MYENGQQKVFIRFKKGCEMVMGMRSALVVGATGLTGGELLKCLCENEEYVSVTVIARRKPAYEHPKLDVIIRAFDEIEENDIVFAHELYCCLGTTIKKARSREAFEQVDFHYPLHVASLAKKRGIPHLLVITAMGARERSLFYYNRVKGKLEQDLQALDLPQLSIIRPSLLVGKREEFRLGEKIGEVLLRILNPLLIGPLKRFRSIEAKQVAFAMMLIALHSPKNKVAIFTSDKLATMKPPVQEEEEPIAREELFNWEKHNKAIGKDSDEGELVDKEVIFNRREE